jgi:hypothetical protein
MSRVFSQFIVSFSVLIFMSTPCLHAGKLSISIDLQIGKEDKKSPFFHYGEKIPVSVRVTNQSQDDVVISKGFTTTHFFTKMRLIDPAGRLLLPKRLQNGGREIPDAPPLPFFLYRGEKPVQVAPCEVFLKEETLSKKLPDLREYYDLELPGLYSAQVQVSAMLFKKDLCSVRDYLWQGVLSSETIYFYFEGKTKIKIIPRRWRINWLEDSPNKPVMAEMYHPPGMTWRDYNLESIRLNHRVAGKVERQQSMLTAYFDPQECIKSISRPKINQPYPAVVSGKMRDGKYFGGGQNITIVP